MIMAKVRGRIGFRVSKRARVGQFTRVTAWDVRMAVRALVLAALAILLAWLVTAATDEGGVAWGVRAGRTLPITPLCAAIGTGLALAPARRRGELRALGALGRAPVASVGGAAAGGAAVALVAAALMALPSVDVSGFFPVAARGSDFRYQDGAFIDRAHGLRVEDDGSFSHIEATASRPAIVLPSRARPAASLSTALAGGALPLLVAELLLARPLGGERPRALGRTSVARLAAMIALAAVATIVLFHAAAAGRVSALAGVIPFAALLGAAVFRYRVPAA
jgi:hypothetical protein